MIHSRESSSTGGDSAMDKVERYRQIVKQLLTEHAYIATTTDTVKAQLSQRQA